jgi:transposase
MEERRKFTREFKLEAVRLIKERGVSYAQASQDLGVHVSQLRNWVKAFADDPQHAFPGKGQMKPEQEEIARLKREVAKQAERDILKRAVVVGNSIRLASEVESVTRLARTFQSTRTRLCREQYMPWVTFCLRHFLADSIICMYVFDFRQAQVSR